MAPTPSRSSAALADPQTTSSEELRGIRAPESGTVRVRRTLVVVNDPKLLQTKSGTAKAELDCQNDDEEGLVQFAGLSVKKVYHYQYTYGALSYELHYTSGNGGSSSYFVVQHHYRIAGMPIASLHELDADIEFLRNALLDRRVRSRRVKAVVSDAQLQQFCKGLMGAVIAYEPSNQNRTLPMRMQIDFVPEQYRQQFKRGCKFEARGKLSLPQLEGDPVEFKVERYEDVDLTDSGIKPWLTGKTPKNPLKVSANSRSREVVSVPKATEQVSRKSLTSAVADKGLAPQKRAPSSATTKETYFKGVVVSDFEVAPDDESVNWGLVYVKEMQSAVSVIVSNVEAGPLTFEEATMVEMRGELKSDGDGFQVLVQFPAIAKLGLLPKPKLPPKPRAAAAKRARYSDLQAISSILRIVEGKVMDVEATNDAVQLDLFVKDSTGKGIVSVVVLGDVSEERAQSLHGQQVDVKGVVVLSDTGSFEYRVADWKDIALKSEKAAMTPATSASNSSALSSPAIAGLKFDFEGLSTKSPANKATAFSESLRSTDFFADATAAVADEPSLRDNEVQILNSIKPEPNADIGSDPLFVAMNQGGGRLPAKLKRGSLNSSNGQHISDSVLGLSAHENESPASKIESAQCEETTFQIPLTPKRKSNTAIKTGDSGTAALGDETPVKRTRQVAARKPLFASTPRKGSARQAKGKGKGKADWTKSMLDDEAEEDDAPDGSVSEQDASFASSIPEGQSTSSVHDYADAHADSSAFADHAAATDFSGLANALNNTSGLEEEAVDENHEE